MPMIFLRIEDRHVLRMNDGSVEIFQFGRPLLQLLHLHEETSTSERNCPV